MTKKTIDLDQHRGMAAQKATDLRRLLADVEANERALRLRQDELEARLIAAPAANWREAAGAGIGTLRWSFFAGNHLEACRLLEIVAAYRKLAHERAARLKLSLGHNQNKESPTVAGLSVRRNVEPENRTCGYRSTDSRLALP
jgi:hypothetical protein